MALKGDDSGMPILGPFGEGEIPNGTRVKKVNSEPGDTFPDGTLGTILGAMANPGLTPDDFPDRPFLGTIKWIYCVSWDPLPGVPIWIADYRIKPIAMK